MILFSRKILAKNIYIYSTIRDLLQFKKREKNPWKTVTFRKATGFKCYIYLFSSRLTNSHSQSEYIAVNSSFLADFSLSRSGESVA